MQDSAILTRLKLNSPWSRELALALFALLLGGLVLPGIIYYAGMFSLGRYEGISPGRLYAAVYAGLGAGSIASWMVVLGPYGLCLAFRGLLAWWQAGAKMGASRL